VFVCVGGRKGLAVVRVAGVIPSGSFGTLLSTVFFNGALNFQQGH
jgi:hypothetical protein